MEENKNIATEEVVETIKNEINKVEVTNKVTVTDVAIATFATLGVATAIKLTAKGVKTLINKIKKNDNVKEDEFLTLDDVENLVDEESIEK